MAQKGIVIEGLKELVDRFHAVPLEIGAKARDAFNDFAADVIKESKPLVPYDPNRKSGTHLRDTDFIRKAASLKNPTTYLGYGAPHAFLVENDIAGKHPAEHYSTPGTGAKFLARTFKAHQGRLEKQIDNILEVVCNNASS